MTLFIAFVASFIGGIVAARVSRFVDSHFHSPAHFYLTEPVEPFGNPLALLCASYCVIAVWLTLLGFIAAMVFHLTGVWQSDTLVVGIIGAFFGFALLYVVTSFRSRCANCGKCLTVQWISQPKFSEPIFGIEGWAAIVLRVAIHRCFRCMYCGQRYVI